MSIFLKRRDLRTALLLQIIIFLVVFRAHKLAATGNATLSDILRLVARMVVGALAFWLGAYCFAHKAPRPREAPRPLEHLSDRGFVRDPNGELFDAVGRGDADAVRRLLAAGFEANVSAQSGDAVGKTPLLFSCSRLLHHPGDVEVARTLIDGGAIVNHSAPLRQTVYGFEGGFTALMGACKDLEVEPVRLLLSRGARANAFEAARYPLKLACGGQGCPRDDDATSEAKCLEIVKLLLEHGAVSTINWRGHTRVVTDYTGSNLLDCDEYLPRLTRSIESNATDMTPFYLACRRNRISVARLLLDRGAEMEYHARWGMYTELFFACRSNNVELAALLLERGADYELLMESYLSRTSLEHVRAYLHPRGVATRGWKPPYVVDLFDPLLPART